MCVTTPTLESPVVRANLRLCFSILTVISASDSYTSEKRVSLVLDFAVVR